MHMCICVWIFWDEWLVTSYDCFLPSIHFCSLLIMFRKLKGQKVEWRNTYEALFELYNEMITITLKNLKTQKILSLRTLFLQKPSMWQQCLLAWCGTVTKLPQTSWQVRRLYNCVSRRPREIKDKELRVAFWKYWKI